MYSGNKQRVIEFAMNIRCKSQVYFKKNAISSKNTQFSLASYAKIDWIDLFG